MLNLGQACVPVLEACMPGKQTAGQTLGYARSGHRPMARGITVAAILADHPDSVEVAPAGTQAVGHAERHLPDARSDARIRHVVSFCHFDDTSNLGKRR